ncbi:MAG: hypothetical protein ACM3Q2_18585 [Syntrophothermus sp.]
MKSFATGVSAVLMCAFLASCGGSQQTQSSSSQAPAPQQASLRVIEDPMADLENQRNQLVEQGSVAAVGQGISKRMDIAKQKARVEAEAALARVFSTKVDNLRKNFVEEVGQGKESEVNEMFSTVTKAFASQTLKGAVEKNSKLMQNEKGEYVAGVLMLISPKTVNLSIMDEMEKGKPQLYQRFRASQAFDELKKEMEEYDKKQNMQ